MQGNERRSKEAVPAAHQRNIPCITLTNDTYATILNSDYLKVIVRHKLAPIASFGIYFLASEHGSTNRFSQQTKADK